jgi:cytochrome c-type biogenesis protein CcmH
MRRDKWGGRPRYEGATRVLGKETKVIWIVFGAMTAAVAAILFIPLSRPGQPFATSEADFARNVYRDQLQELDRDLSRGLISADDAAAARNEISRRLLGAGDVPATPATTLRYAWLAVLLVPLVALPTYYRLGSPASADVPLAARIDNAVKNNDFAALVAQAEKHLADHPDDLNGWKVVAPAYKSEKRWDDAAQAYLRILQLAPPTAEGYADYGEMLVVSGEGMVSDQAHQAFRAALKLDPKSPRARFFDALALKQEGNRDEAKKRFEAFLADSPADAPWRPILDQELKDLSNAKAPVLSEDQIAAGKNMSSQDQATMINAMMDRLEQRLGSDSRDLDGWKRLIRARSVSQNLPKAQKALQTAREIFKTDQVAIDDLNGLAKELELK